MAIVEKMMRLHSPIDRMSHRSAGSFRMLAATSRALKRAATSAWGMVGLVSARDASTLARSQPSRWDCSSTESVFALLVTICM